MLYLPLILNVSYIAIIILPRNYTIFLSLIVQFFVIANSISADPGFFVPTYHLYSASLFLSLFIILTLNLPIKRYIAIMGLVANIVVTLLHNSSIMHINSLATSMHLLSVVICLSTLLLSSCLVLKNMVCARYIKNNISINTLALEYTNKLVKIFLVVGFISLSIAIALPLISLLQHNQSINSYKIALSILMWLIWIVAIWRYTGLCWNFKKTLLLITALTCFLLIILLLAI